MTQAAAVNSEKKAKMSDPSESNAQNILKVVRWTFGPYKWVVGSALSIGLVARGAFLMQTNVVGWWADSLCGQGQFCKGQPSWTQGWGQGEFVLALALLTLIGLLGTIFYRMTYGRTASRAISQLYDEATMRVSRFPMRYFDTTEMGRIMTRFSSDYGNVFRVIGGPMAEFISLAIEILLIFGLMIAINPGLILLVAPMMTSYLVLYRRNRPQMDFQRRKQAAARAPGIAHFAETLQGALSIRTYKRVSNFTTRFSREDDVYLRERFLQQKLTATYGFKMGAVTAFYLCVFSVSSYFLLQKQYLSVGQVGVVIGFILSLNSTVLAFFELLPQIEECRVGLERLGAYLFMPLELGNSLPANAKFETPHLRWSDQGQTPSPCESRGGRIELQNVWFRYYEGQSWILRDINIEISSGERIGIVGKTGSGKTSLIQALFHLYPIEKGTILLNGEPVRTSNTNNDGIELNQYRRQMAYISQDPTLFAGTLRENVDMEGTHTDEQVVQVLEKVGLGEWFHQRAKSLNFFLNERGRNVSQGERQLICMGRCLLQNAPIIVLDEATSNVDPQSEELMMKAILGKGPRSGSSEQIQGLNSECGTHDDIGKTLFEDKTQIIIAHRLSTLETCHRVLWLDQGQVKAFGPTREVLSAFMKSGGRAELH